MSPDIEHEISDEHMKMGKVLLYAALHKGVE